MLLCQHQHLIAQDFHHPTFDLEILQFLLVILDLYFAAGKDGNQRGMIVQDFKRSIDAGKLNKRHFAGKKGLFGGDYFELHTFWSKVPGLWSWVSKSYNE